ncbi:MAG TPA: DUF1549 domain-containing protein [Bryobacteraceae bacterium]|nr:DUF1549 domain-containing protein [Bryobacteraceae bacterium]
MFWVKSTSVVVVTCAFVSLVSVPILPADEIESKPLQGCSFTAKPDEFLSAQSRIRSDISETTGKISRARYGAKQGETVPASEIPRRNLIDDEIFGKLASMNVRSAPVSTDEEFLRRIMLDLTGRIPSPSQIRAFVADSSADKRTQVIDDLLASEEFTDKFTLWMGDLLQNTATALSTSGINRQIDGRNAFYNYIRRSIAADKSFHDIAWETITATGNNYAEDNGAVNFLVGIQTAGGPVQDSFDMALTKTATVYLGMGHYDCVGCHNGRGHLDQISLWGKNATRTEAWRMAAFFSRTKWSVRNNQTTQYTDRYYNSTEVNNNPSGQYEANTNFGNRPFRCANALPPDPKTNRCLANQSITPEYRVTGAKPKDSDWRSAYAANLTSDPMFARNFANRLWKVFFNLGLVDPVDTLDPDRLDPANPPPAPWTLQATHPELLEKLAGELEQGYFKLRPFVKLLVSSSAYQLSSRYDSGWRADYVPLFARHYPRRLDGEEVHDSITQATGVPGKYTVQATIYRTAPTEAVQMMPDAFTSAMRLPDTAEPRSNGAVANFINVFIRGNRDTQPRVQAASVLQQLSMMNDAFVNNRTRISASPTLAAIAKISTNADVVDEMFLTVLARTPSQLERDRALAFLNKAGTNAAARNTAIEDLAWACINKVDFLFSY